MWSVVEKTALAEAEVEYEDYTSDTVWVKFPVKDVAAGWISATLTNDTLTNENCSIAVQELQNASVVIWTTTPWTLPGNRAIVIFSQDRIWPLRGHRRCAGQLGKIGDQFILRTICC